MKTLDVKSSKREEMIEITLDVEKLVSENAANEGICVLFTQHTTCGLTINENADPDVKSDMLGFLQKLIPQYYEDFKHFEHNSDAYQIFAGRFERHGAVRKRQIGARQMAGNLSLRI